MIDARETELSDTLKVANEPNSSADILRAIDDASRAFDGYLNYCKTVDQAYSLTLSTANAGYQDDTFALFWASMEIVKPAIYAKPPKPVASPRFKDGGKLDKTVSELMERSLESTFDRGDMDEVMLGARDDLALTNRGVAWVTYETDKKGGGQRVCIEHLDRIDFLHEPARKWPEVGWVARRAWMTFKEMKERFKDRTEDQLNKANFDNREKKSADYGMMDSSQKAGVWEVWHKGDNKVYWVTEGVEEILEEDEPHLNLQGFFPCPKPAYGTLQRRTLIPVPDYKRYSYHLDQVNDLTARIYTLLNQVRLKAFIPAGGDVGDAVEAALKSSDDTIIIPVPAAAFSGQSSTGLMMTLPLKEVAETIQGLIAARGQLIEDFYQLSGISDIMRGATESDETLGAQQLKSQFGSVRVRDKIDELARLARDVARISAEIIAENFSKETLLDLSRMTIPTKSEVKKKIEELKEAARDEMEQLTEQVQEQAGQISDPEQAQQAQAQFQQQQMQIAQKYKPLLDELAGTVPIEDVMEMLRDEKARNLSIDIETDSTILTDEIEEKRSRSEFLTAFANASAAVQPLLMAGEPGAKLAGGMIKFALQPFRAGRELDELVEDFVENAPSMAAPQEGGGEAEQAMAQANLMIAQAEATKAQAAVEKVKADTAAKMQDTQQKAQEAAIKAEQDSQKFQLEIAQTRGNLKETDARIEKIAADIQLAFAKLGIEQSKEQRETFKTVADIEGQQQDRAMQAQNAERDAAFRAQDASRAERGEERADRQQQFSERSGERQMTLAERQAERETTE